MSNQKNLPDWVQSKHIENKKTEQEFLNKKYLNLPEGTTTVWIDLDTAPTEIDGQFGKRYQYKAKTQPTEEYRILSASKILDRLIVEALSINKNPMQITRVGKGKFTRYAVS